MRPGGSGDGSTNCTGGMRTGGGGTSRYHGTVAGGGGAAGRTGGDTGSTYQGVGGGGAAGRGDGGTRGRGGGSSGRISAAGSGPAGRGGSIIAFWHLGHDAIIPAYRSSIVSGTLQLGHFTRMSGNSVGGRAAWEWHANRLLENYTVRRRHASGITIR